VHSPFGQVLKAIRENEPRAISLGYDVDRYKLLAFVLSAALSGLAGSTKTLVLGFETLTDVTLAACRASVVLMTLLGGMGTVLGAGGRRLHDHRAGKQARRPGRLAGHAHVGGVVPWLG
jgi:branched-chain amino acid transport system permease protein